MRDKEQRSRHPSADLEDAGEVATAQDRGAEDAEQGYHSGRDGVAELPRSRRSQNWTRRSGARGAFARAEARPGLAQGRPAARAYARERVRRGRAACSEPESLRQFRGLLATPQKLAGRGPDAVPLL